MHNDHRRAETITDVFFPSGPSRRCSTSHSRQCPGTLPTGGSQSMFSVSGPARTYTLSVVGGFTGNIVVKTMAGWVDLFFFSIERWRASVRTVVLDLQRDELLLQGPFGRRAIHTEVDVCEKREWRSCKPTAAPDASGDDVVWTFLYMLQFHVPGVG